jgi:hypothetical protein
VSGSDDYGSHSYPPDGHEAADSEPAHELDGEPDQLDAPPLDDEDHAQSHADAGIGDQFHDFGAPAKSDQGHDSGHSPDSMAAELWREGLPGEPLPVDRSGHVLGPGELLDQLITRLEDPAPSDVARAVREGPAP